MPRSFTRAGVEAAVRLSKIDSKDTWEAVEQRYEDMLRSKGGEKRVILDAFCEKLAHDLKKNDPPKFTKKDLMNVVDWKFAKGKPRYPLIKLLESNADDFVESCATEAFELASIGNIRKALDVFSMLKGVGPATASAVLSLYRPDKFAFMDDEVIECLHEGKRGYTVKIYMHVNERCSSLSTMLGEPWTARRVGKALWTSARLAADGEEDCTLQISDDGGAKEYDHKNRKRKIKVKDEKYAAPAQRTSKRIK
jgi:hypothetical protein